MGYTHYYSINGKKIPQKQFKAIVSDVKRIEDYIKKNVVYSKNAGGNYIEHRVTLHDGWGEGKGVEYTVKEQDGKQKVIAFSLNGTVKGDLGHESMYLELNKQEGLGGFCKTARKPYDLVVCMVLLSLKYHVPTSQIGSDGYMEDWEHSVELYKKIFAERNVEFIGLAKTNDEHRYLGVMEFEKPIKPMKIKKDAFDLVKS